jgi:hypothetical protein
MAKYLQGKYIPKHPEKYIGDVKNVFFRSSWERKLMIYLDENPAILKWGSEELIIPYRSPVDGKNHRYFPDMVVMYKTKNDEIKHAVIEVKPLAQTKPPKATMTGKNTKRFIKETITYAVNSAKWTAATAWCKHNNFDFIILTEVELKV